jgi:hypothetical protein
MRTRTKVLAIAAVALPLIAWEGYIALRWSPSRTAAALLEQAPRGTTKEVVRALIRDKGWLPGGLCGVEERSNCLSVKVGNFEGLLGLHHIFAEWHFDDRDRLTDLHVYNACFNYP